MSAIHQETKGTKDCSVLRKRKYQYDGCQGGSVADYYGKSGTTRKPIIKSEYQDGRTISLSTRTA